MEINVDQIDEVLSTARSVRKNLDFDRPVDRQVLLDCIDVAVQAPVGLGGENWRFVVVDDPAPKQDIAKLYGEILTQLFEQRGMEMKPTHRALMDRLHDMPAMIFVCVDGLPPDDATASQIGFYGSILPAAWSLMLALRARNLGTTWTSLLTARQDDVAKDPRHAGGHFADGDVSRGAPQRRHPAPRQTRPGHPGHLLEPLGRPGRLA